MRIPLARFCAKSFGQRYGHLDSAIGWLTSRKSIFHGHAAMLHTAIRRHLAIQKVVDSPEPHAGSQESGIRRRLLTRERDYTLIRRWVFDG
ncbi:hypothetical protein BST61_g4754 [Cercospora zeina]